MCGCARHQNMFNECTCICPEHRNFEMAYDLAMERYEVIQNMAEELVELRKLKDKVKALAGEFEANGNSRELGDPSSGIWHHGARMIHSVLSSRRTCLSCAADVEVNTLKVKEAEVFCPNEQCDEYLKCFWVER